MFAAAERLDPIVDVLLDRVRLDVAENSSRHVRGFVGADRIRHHRQLSETRIRYQQRPLDPGGFDYLGQLADAACPEFDRCRIIPIALEHEHGFSLFWL